MLSKRCKIMVWVVLTLFMVSLGPSIALADSSPGISLEEAIKIVKNTFEVPQEFQEFSSGFANYDKRQIWHLNWNALQEPGSQGAALMPRWMPKAVKLSVCPTGSRVVRIRNRMPR